MTKQKRIFTGPLAELGGHQSLLAPQVVGFMRRLGMTAAITTGAAAVGLGYARWESKQPVLRRHTVTVDPRPGFTGLRILHLSDLHMFPGQQFIVDFIKRVAEQAAFDLVISTGDNLGNKDAIDLLLQAYEPLVSYPGAFVLGSNDYYSPKTKNWLNYLRRDRGNAAISKHKSIHPDLPWLQLVQHLTASGWIDLSNRADQLLVPTPHGAQSVALIGVDDPHLQRDRVPAPNSDWDQREAFRLGVTHAPYRRVLDAFTNDGADLILAGHTHGGQIRLPGYGAIVTNCDIPRSFSRGLHRWTGPNGGTYLNVSAGLGTSPLAPIRFACRPEASLLEILPG